MCWRDRRNKSYRHRWQERFARKLPSAPTQQPVWIHAVSVGESVAATPIVNAMRERFPSVPILFTTTTPTGADTAISHFGDMARRWFNGASIVTGDHLVLNDALVRGDIDFYLSGGVYTASPARLAGHRNIRAVTPKSGPIDGKGGIVFMEITSVIDNLIASPDAEDFLEYLMTPEIAMRMAFAEGTCNPVTQMGDPKVFSGFSAAQLDAIQWETLEEDVGRSAEYAIIPSYAALLVILKTAKCESGWN